MFVIIFIIIIKNDIVNIDSESKVSTSLNIAQQLKYNRCLSPFNTSNSEDSQSDIEPNNMVKNKMSGFYANAHVHNFDLKNSNDAGEIQENYDGDNSEALDDTEDNGQKTQIRNFNCDSERKFSSYYQREFIGVDGCEKKPVEFTKFYKKP